MVVIEGPDGSGKTTQMEMLRDWLVARGEEVVVAREPGGTAIGEGIRQLFKDNFGHTDPMTEALMMLAARNQLDIEVIAPALQRGAWVITDRHTPSMYAYQGAGHKLGFGLLNKLRDGLADDYNRTPFATIILSVPKEERERRMDERGGRDKIDDADQEFRNRVADAYTEMLYGNWNLKIGVLHDVDGSGSPAEVHERILDTLWDALPRGISDV